MRTIRLTMAQALVRYLAALRVESDDGERLFAGVFAIFGHGNVAGVGEALYASRETLTTYRAHNEQAMAHAAIAFAKASMRRRMMACTTSIGPGATNLITAAATAHVNRLPVLFLPGDVFVSRAPDPVLQQVEFFQDGTVSVNDTFRPVSRYFDRIVHPAQLLTALPRAIHVLTDAALCGPVTLALPQDVQAMAFDYPERFFTPSPVRFDARRPNDDAIAEASDAIRRAKRPLLIAGGGVLYAQAIDALRAFASTHGVPVAETQAGKSALPWNDPLQLGAIGVTGSTAANEVAREADVVLAVGTRLQDFTTGSHSLFPQAQIIGVNVNGFDALKWSALPVVGDAGAALVALSGALGDWRSEHGWVEKARSRAKDWQDTVLRLTSERDVELPYDGDVIGAVQRSTADSAANDIVVCAAGTLPGELHKLWRASVPGGYHVEYGYSCMGYEIAGGIGVKMAQPRREVIVLVGDGSYLMLNAEIATSVMLGHKLVIVVLDNQGYGCINRLQQAVGSAPFNNLFEDCVACVEGPPSIDFAMNARSLGATAEHVSGIAQLEEAMQRARAARSTYVIVIDTDPSRTTVEGGHWWDVAVPEVSSRDEVNKARAEYDAGRKAQQS
ncbi:MAG TPA: 3D-(3,5/4)-trihydroxycyclohexane-1,2-dione acylhydrolase (decyclizing) [Casimicrobiaceae bacterium]|nr:3D-(3,5/4)-trihydroxycyclohexane-1,2-dione acylhydrolase (decyclizing) [Casimicrobiaceae bacterium]